jgi:DNA-3-methyladenine glycosylase I
MAKIPHRCAWAGTDDPLMIAYHDKEWGKPVHDDKVLFEFLILEGAQAGLSWRTILHKRATYRKALANWEARKVARFGVKDVARLMANPGIVRNKLKVAAAITNAQKLLEVRKEFGSFDVYIWGFVGGKPVKNKIATLKDVPAKTAVSDAMSKDLAKRGFKFVGSTICYAFMQATGMVNDHEAKCFARKTR